MKADASTTAARGWLADLRSAAGERFAAMSWPTLEDEDWRRTDLSRFDLSDLRADSAAEGRPVERGAEQASSGPERSGPQGSAGYLRFDAGECAELAVTEGLRSRGLRLESIGVGADRGDGSVAGDALVADLLRDAYAAAEDRVAVWHFARLRYGASLFVPPGLEVEEPFVIDFEEGSGSAAGALFAAPQVAISLGEGASATVILRLREPSGARVLSTARTNISLGAASSLRLFDSRSLGPESLHFQSSRARLAQGSRLERLEVQLGARLARTRFECSLEGRGSEASLDGLYYCARGQHADVGTVLRHASSGATSRATYKGAVSGGGRAVFQGLIEVGKGASGTDAYLSNRNLLLGDAARADSIPTLRIGNDDVRCSHGSATGRIGAEELFYLQSRGLSEEQAREIIVLGFFEDLLAKAPESFREDNLELIRRGLADAA